MLKPITTPIIILPCIDENEKWCRIGDIAVPNIRPHYYISTYGRIFSAISNRLLNPTISTVGYYVVNIVLNDGTQSCIYIHRTMLITFEYIENYYELQVNHKDGNKLNNMIFNLEWVTLVENNRHAYNMGLTIKGEACPWSKLTDDQVHKICQLYIEGHGITELSRIFNCGVTTIFDIIHNKTRKDISCQYNIIPRLRNIVNN